MPSVASGAPRTMATSLTMTLLPRSGDPKPYAPTAKPTIRTGIVTQAHSRRSRRLQDEVVDRADQRRCSRRAGSEQPADRRQGEATAGCATAADDLAVVADAAAVPLERGRDQAPPQRLGELVTRRSSRRSDRSRGPSPSRCRTARSAATTRSPDVARARPAASSPASAGTSVASSAGARRGARRARRGRRRSSRSAGRAGCRRGSRRAARCPAVPPTMMSRPPRASQPRSAASCSRA